VKRRKKLRRKMWRRRKLWSKLLRRKMRRRRAVKRKEIELKGGKHNRTAVFSCHFLTESWHLCKLTSKPSW
jgi:hypothetical protein